MSERNLYLVTGGGGFIGSNITEALVGRGDRVRVLDDFSTGRRENLAGAPEVDGYEKLQARQPLSRSQRAAQTMGSPLATGALV